MRSFDTNERRAGSPTNLKQFLEIVDKITLILMSDIVYINMKQKTVLGLMM